MSETAGIGRAPSDEERKDYKQIGNKTLKDRFLIELSKVEATFTRNHLPFDSQCAKNDFYDKIESIEKESERRSGFVRAEDIESVNFGDLEKYGDLKRFTIEGDDEEIEMQNINNTRAGVTTGHTVKYVCKERGHGCSVFIPQDLYEERFVKKQSSKPEEVKGVK